MYNGPPSRRHLLSAGLAAGLTAAAGCLDSLRERSDAARPDSDRVLQLDLWRRDGPLRGDYVVDLDETRPDRDEEAFAATLDGIQYETQYRKPFGSSPGDPTYTTHDGTYYRLGSVVVGEVATTHPVLRLFEAGRADESSTPSGVDASELPVADERAVRIAHLAARARGDVGGVPWGLVERGGYVYRAELAGNGSRLLTDDGPTHVTYRRRVYDVEVARERFHEPVYRAIAEPVAGSPDGMESILRAKFVDARVSRDDLPGAARDVVRTAGNGGYGETHPYSSAYRTVLRALHERAYLDGNIAKDASLDEPGRGTLEYAGGYYDYRLHFRSRDGTK